MGFIFKLSSLSAELPVLVAWSIYYFSHAYVNIHKYLNPYKWCSYFCNCFFLLKLDHLVHIILQPLFLLNSISRVPFHLNSYWLGTYFLITAEYPIEWKQHHLIQSFTYCCLFWLLSVLIFPWIMLQYISVCVYVYSYIPILLFPWKCFPNCESSKCPFININFNRYSQTNFQNVCSNLHFD